MKLFIIKEQLLVEAQLQNLIGKYKGTLTEDHIKAIVQLDPTAIGNNAGKYSEWIIKQVVDAIQKSTYAEADTSSKQLLITYLIESIGELRDLYSRLTIFNKYSKYIGNGSNDIYQFKSINDFCAAVHTFSTSARYKQLEAEAKQKALYKEAKTQLITVHDGTKWKVLIPQTYAASRVIAGDTRWCTAASDYGSEYFDKYIEETGDSDYYIIINKRDPAEKYQLHFGSHQLMDRNDDRVDIQHLFEIAPEIIQPIYNREVKKGTIHQQAENQTISLNYTQVEDEISNHLVAISDRYETYLFNNIKDELVTRIRKNPSLKDILQQLESADDKDSFLAQVVFNKYTRLKKLAEPVVVAIKAVMYKEIKENSDADFSLEYSIKNKYIDDDAIDATITLHLDNWMPADILLAAFLHKKTKSTIYQYLVKALSYRKIIAESAALNVKAQEEFLNSAYDIVLNSTE